MRKKVGPSLYFASDKVIFDSLTHRQVKTDLIRDLLFERGIITSSKTPKEDLAIYFSRIPADYFDFKSIGGKLGRVSRRERITFAEVTGELAPDQIIRAFQAVKGTLEAKGHTVQIESKNDRVVAVISYEHIDYTEVEFRQVQQRDAVIEFVRDGKTSPYFVRNTQNAFADAAVEEVFSALATTTGSKLNRKYISLEGIVDFKARTRFFESLMRGIDKHEFVTVTEAYCYKPRTISIEDESDDDDRKDLEEQPYVERVGLRGKGVNRSFVIDELYGKGYYIVKVLWQVKPKASLDSDVFELEAQFSTPDTCTDFSYQAKGVLLFEDGKITDKRRMPKSDEEDAIYRMLEASAQSALKEVGDAHAKS